MLLPPPLIGAIMRSILKMVFAWLLLNAGAGFLVGLLFLPFKGTAGLEEHSGFVIKVLIGVGLFGFIKSSYFNQGSGFLTELSERKSRHLVLALKYLSFYILGISTVILLLVAVVHFSAPSIGASGERLFVSQDFLRFEALQSSVYGGIALYLIGSCLVAPVIEEVFYRKILYTGLRKQFSPAASIALSAIFFGVFHHNILVATLDGAYLAFVYEREQSLQVNVILHILLNISAVSLMAGIYFCN